jgi:hypothetical protein
MKIYKSGSKLRYDGKGSEFGNIHRELPKDFGMFDIDNLKGHAIINYDLTLRNQNEAFIEYRVNWDNSTIEWKAMFEIKYKKTEHSEQALQCKIGTSTWAQLKLCEQIECRYFVIYSNNGKQPFEFYEIYSINEFEHIGTLNYTNENRKEQIENFWKQIKLF